MEQSQQPPVLLQGPEPIETSELHFKLQCKVKVFESKTKNADGKCSLLAVSQHYGLIFIGKHNGFSVIKTKLINSATNINDFPKKDVPLSFKTTHISVDFSQKILAVVCSSNPGAILNLYSIASLSAEEITALKVLPLTKIVQNLSAEASELSWQPNAEGILIVCMSDGSVLSLNQATKEGSVHVLPSSTQAVCFCWSPKGKQIVIGCANGTLSQYKPDLKLVKTLPAPPLFDGAPYIVSVLWLSNYQFAAAYRDKNNSNIFPVIVIVNAPKNETVKYINYEDITYSSTLFRNHQIYMLCQSTWNLIFISSSNSIEVAVLHSKDNSNWEQWLLGDASRAELPLNANRQETFPIGLGLDFTSEEVITWGERKLSPMPRLLVLSNEGILCIFNIVNVSESVPELCGPPKEELPDSVFKSKTSTMNDAILPKTHQVTQSNVSQPVSNIVTPTFTFGINASSVDGKNAKPQITQAPINISTSKDTSAALQQQQLLQLLQQQKQQQVLQPKQQIPQQINTNLFQGGQSTVSQKFISSSLPHEKSEAPVNSSDILVSPSTLDTKQVNSKPVQGFAAPQIPVSKSNSQSEQDKMKALPQSTPIKNTEPAAKPLSKSVITKEKKNKPKVEEDQKATSPAGKDSTALTKMSTADDSIYWNALQDEIDHFNSELQQLSIRVGNLNVEVGKPADKENLQKSIQHMYDFWQELRDTTVSQGGEIHSVMADLMESFAWLEDAKSRNLQRKNPSFIEMKKVEELDPISLGHMNEIAHLKYYIENQLKQLTSHLEKEWMEHQDDYRMEVKNKMIVPSLEEVYKTMHFQLKILSKQRALVDELKAEIAARKRKNKSFSTIATGVNSISSSVQGSNRVSELSKLAENLLQLRINRDENSVITENRDALRSHMKTIIERTKKLTSHKQNALRDILSEQDMVKIRPVKSTLQTSAFLRSLAVEKSLQKLSSVNENGNASNLSGGDTKKIENSQSLIQKNDNSRPILPAESKSIVSPEAGQKTLKESAEEKQENINKTARPIFVFGSSATPTSTLSLTPQSASQPVEIAPAKNLFGSETATVSKSNSSNFTFGIASVITTANSKDSPVIPSVENKPQKKVEEVKPVQIFTFEKLKAPDLFRVKKPESQGFGEKPIFGSVTPSDSNATTTPTSVSKTTGDKPLTTSYFAVAPSMSFTFNATPSTINTNSSVLPKVNLVFGAKDQISVSKEATSGSTIFSSQATNASLFPSSTSTMSSSFSKSDSPVASSFSSVFPKSTSSNVTPVNVSFSQTLQTGKTSTVPSEVSIIKSRPETETEDVDVESVDEPVALEETPVELKTTAVTSSSIITGGTSLLSKTSAEVTTAVAFSSANASPQNVSVTQSSSVTTTNIFTKPVMAAASNEVTVGSNLESLSQTPVVTTAATSYFTFGIGSPITFASTSATVVTTPTTAASALKKSPTTTSVPAVVSAVTTAVSNTDAAVTAINTTIAVTSTTFTTSIFGQIPTSQPADKPLATTAVVTNIFGGNTTPTTSTNIFGKSSTPTSSKPIFGQSAGSVTPTTVSIFGNATPVTLNTNTFGQVSTPSSTSSAFNDSVSQTANIFGQLLSDSNRSDNLFGTPSTTITTTAFSTPKNIFGGVSTTASVFGGTSSPVFPQTTSVFGQSTPAGANTFGQSPSSNSFFGQNICSPFGGNSSTTTNQDTFGRKPIFGQSLFGQSANKPSAFSFSSSASSIFGGSANSTSTSSVFQTTTSNTFESAAPGPFSSNQGSVAETGFRASNTFQKPLSGFGSPPVFGGGPSTTAAFGVAPTFSGSATFGSQPTFGSRPGRAFDTSQAGFSQSQGSTTFENLASKDTVGFAYLAQGSQTQGFGGFSSSSAFENKPAFGGSSFSNWRSN